MVAQHRLANASIDGLTDHSAILTQDSIDVLLSFDLHSPPLPLDHCPDILVMAHFRVNCLDPP